MREITIKIHDSVYAEMMDTIRAPENRKLKVTQSDWINMMITGYKEMQTQVFVREKTINDLIKNVEVKSQHR